MREKMFRDNEFHAAVFIGGMGRSWTNFCCFESCNRTQ